MWLFPVLLNHDYKERKKDILPGKLALYDKLVETNPDIKRKGATLPYTSHNGHMFTFLSPSGELGIRLPENDREEFIKKYKTTLMKAQGTIMKEYVAVPDQLFKSTNDLKKYFDLSYEYVKSLKPKPQKKAKSE